MGDDAITTWVGSLAAQTDLAPATVRLYAADGRPSSSSVTRACT